MGEEMDVLEGEAALALGCGVVEGGGGDEMCEGCNSCSI